MAGWGLTDNHTSSLEDPVGRVSGYLAEGKFDIKQCDFIVLDKFSAI